MNPGEVWLVDLGMAGKVRPCLLLTGYPADHELALVTILPHTTALRDNEWSGLRFASLAQGKAWSLCASAGINRSPWKPPLRVGGTPRGGRLPSREHGS